MSGEVITIFVGQAGAQLATFYWELLCTEYGIKTNGFLYESSIVVDPTTQAFFTEKAISGYKPLTLIVDLEPTAIDKIKIGNYKCLFDEKCLIHGFEDAANNYAKGYYTVGREMIDLVLCHIRRIYETCCNLQRFIIFRSSGGGTGSGFTTLLLEHLTEIYPKVSKMDFTISSTPNLSMIKVEPYNAMLTTCGSLAYEDCCFILENESLYDICKKKLNIGLVTYTNLNRLQAQITGNMITSMLSKDVNGGPNARLDDLRKILVPYPRVPFSIIAYSPLTTPSLAAYSDLSVYQLMQECFQPDNQVVKCDCRTGAYISGCLLYNGDVSKNDISKALVDSKDRH
ncbi:tubulin alpha-2 chain-like isoform X2 [Prorops nasuta]|uniref:tubulin alpha-2 chain-like isoform X2 n=1 Tax=Prorops nasuta TaxID=863751 RepID=UPI0034CFD524